MAKSFRSLIISGLLIALFVIAMLTFTLQISIDNEVDSPLLENDAVRSMYEDLNNTIKEQQSIADGSKDVFEEKKPFLGESILIESIVSVGKTVTGSFNVLNNLITGFIATSLGLKQDSVGQAIFGTFLAILIFILILAAWRLYKTGT